MLNFKSVNIIAGLTSMGLFILFFIDVISPLYFGFSLFIWFLITGFGSAFIGWNYFFKSLNANYNTKKKQIAITFDDGPNATFTPKVLQLLKQYDAKATFFCIGKHIEAHPEVFKTLLNEGHVVGNHTYSHSHYFGFFGTQRVIKELESTNRIIEKISGLKVKLYRPAFGVTNPNIKKAISQMGLHSVGWSKRSLDTTGRDEKAVLKRIINDLKPGDVILLHDTSEKTIRVLEQLLLFLQQQKLSAVTIDTLFDIKAYA
ncbi:polysaccharide deacetylase family protein [Tamlana sp. s12]|uniref:polysaccharide deacetylase family protein n=1 Tax=Tamlana sp. s12 TaxID=1630406 RepID=UPI0008006475|nr:polysaccharide deacetylase family protein [Tamlana sp. s12]OBQ54697.1 polysaccharide deacetylase [Tamlana sp. s12]QQY82193.1 polysaccharide deacetylase family protein [Tamlana sp. s12]